MLSREEVQAATEKQIADAVGEMLALETLRKQEAAERREQIKEVKQRIAQLSKERDDCQQKLPFGKEEDDGE